MTASKYFLFSLTWHGWAAAVAQWYSTHLQSKTLEVVGLILALCWALLFTVSPSVVHPLSGTSRKCNTTDFPSQKIDA